MTSGFQLIQFLINHQKCIPVPSNHSTGCSNTLPLHTIIGFSSYSTVYNIGCYTNEKSSTYQLTCSNKLLILTIKIFVPRFFLSIALVHSYQGINPPHHSTKLVSNYSTEYMCSLHGVNKLHYSTYLASNLCKCSL